MSVRNPTFKLIEENCANRGPPSLKDDSSSKRGFEDLGIPIYAIKPRSVRIKRNRKSETSTRSIEKLKKGDGTEREARAACSASYEHNLSVCWPVSVTGRRYGNLNSIDDSRHFSPAASYSASLPPSSRNCCPRRPAPAY